VNLINQRCAQIAQNFMRLHVNIEFVSTDKSLRKVLTPIQRKKVLMAMHKPVQLSPLGQRALNLYEDAFIVVFNLNRGRHIAC
jgi:hypothetical protein